MTRITSTAIQNEIAKTNNLSFHIAKIEFASPSGTSFISEGPEVTVSGDAYLDSSLSVKSISFGNAGFEKATIELLDYSNSAIALFLQNKIIDVVCTISIIYRGANGAFTTPVVLAVGILNPKSMSEDKVVLELSPKGKLTNFYPKIYFNSDNGATYLAASGKIVEWGDEKFELVN